MAYTRLPDWTHEQAISKIGRRVRAVRAMHAYGIPKGATGTITGVLHYKDHTAELLVTWDLPKVMILHSRRELRDIFNRHDYKRMLGEITSDVETAAALLEAS